MMDESSASLPLKRGRMSHGLRQPEGCQSRTAADQRESSVGF
ncbi:unnamed protein product [Protopolystoma xenopodis]|uniref:Uncharacterized protein n=1 Tax=Protopolystoma xenopodis TaxID=117903 RepID=A0A448X526_9PLAT|nr:unnamed protein product [Protopolystoma xenopodis]